MTSHHLCYHFYCLEAGHWRNYTGHEFQKAKHGAILEGVGYCSFWSLSLVQLRLGRRAGEALLKQVQGGMPVRQTDWTAAQVHQLMRYNPSGLLWQKPSVPFLSLPQISCGTILEYAKAQKGLGMDSSHGEGGGCEKRHPDTLTHRRHLLSAEHFIHIFSDSPHHIVVQVQRHFVNKQVEA